MRVAAFATLALGLVLAALWLALGAPAPALAVGPSQVDDVTIRMVRNGQPESVFPSDTKTVNGVVTYNIRGNDNTPIARRTTISVLDPVGLEVYSETFQTDTSYVGSATKSFSVSGDQMMTVYRTIAASQSQTAQSSAQAIAPATTSVTNAMLTSVSAVQYAATQARLATERMQTFSEVPNATKTLLAQASSDLQTAINRADAIVSAGACNPAGQDCSSKVTSFNQNLQTIQQKTQSAQTAITQALSQISGLSNLSVPLTNQCLYNAQNQPVQQTYTSVVLQVVPPSTTATRRDTWEWQVGDPSAFAQSAILTAAPSTIYTQDVTIVPTHTSQIRATVLDPQCLPVLDGVNVNFATTLGTLTPTSTTTSSSGGLHGLASTTLQAGNQAGNAVVTVTGLSANQTAAQVAIVGPARTITFQTGSGQQTSLIIQRGAQTQIEVRVVDVNNNPVADGTVVQFSVTNGAGTFNPPSVTVFDGIARTMFTAGSNSANATITAQVPGTTAQALLQITIAGDPANIQLRVQDTYSTTLYLNTSDQSPYTFVEAVVKDAQGNPVADGTMVEFILDAAGKAVWDHPTDSQGIVTQAPTTGGVARAKLTATPGGANTTVGVIARVVGTNIIVPPFNALQITIKAPKAYNIYLPAIFRIVQCGRGITGGCAPRPPLE